MKFSIALIGHGYWGEKIARCLKDSDQYELRAIVDPSPKTTITTTAKIYSCLKDALKNTPDLQAVAVAIPVTQQADLVEQVLQAGLHVLVTKTLATSSSTAQKLIQMAQNKNKALFVDYTFLHAQGFQKMRELVLKRPKEYRPILIDMRRRALGKFDHSLPVHWDLACHDLSLALSLFPSEKIRSIQAIELSRHYQRPSQTEIILEVADFKIRINSAWDSPQKIREIELLGTQENLLYSGCYPKEKLSTCSKGHYMGVDNKVQYSSLSWSEVDFTPLEPLPEMIREFSQMILSPRSCPSQMYLQIIHLLESADQSLIQGGKKLIL